MFCTCVGEDQAGVVEVFGKFDKMAAPGFHCFPVPCVCQMIGRVNTRIQEITVDVRTKTSDNVFVTLVICTNIEVKKEDDKRYHAFYKFSNPRSQIELMVEDVVRSVVPTIDLDSIFVQKNSIAENIRERLEIDLDVSGYTIISSLILDINPDSKVVESMNSINYNRRLRAAEVEKSESEKFVQIKQAEAQSEVAYYQGMGLSKQRSAIVEGLRESLEAFAAEIDISPKEILHLMIISQYFDALKDISSEKKAKVFMLPKKRNISLAPWTKSDKKPEALSIESNRFNIKELGKSSKQTTGKQTTIPSMPR
ncbi:putative Hypersensitive-induced response protein 2 [Cardiosporidium cionae]|uniref:Hypersensitive-induced response protein 2 n=1 Tax=Cardiosporidium cionae TaxID=476202 RepID=A0ABQ7J9F5_9APIC|nr:putative Hypersensitive-induced response protein 2 [Cardiosporidium cionae]|eukprot:KAF8820629.1 putative Hypersensitive-induced response protein 2 [Cardiosporidium cionae]